MNPYSRKSDARSFISPDILFFSKTDNGTPPWKPFMISYSRPSSISFIAAYPFANTSPWLRWEPKIISSSPSVYAIPTAAASCPVYRWAGPVYV
jgi:hypothetical protein